MIRLELGTQHVARWFGVSQGSIERCHHHAAIGGMDGLVSRHGGGRPSALNAAQLNLIRLDLHSAHDESPEKDGLAGWSGKDLAKQIKRASGWISVLDRASA